MTDSGRKTRKILTALALLALAGGFYLSAFVMLSNG
ncbi:hypothetical protein SAMN05421508_106316 [Caenispirillum bisanense]|uniref:Uncharacterized protein n=1 Tax=Caenispirillum bisanense TaxID=414052 RepID=A0A286GNW0_9PROT|nr:hypothetical protein SAMN05421508_106316 [Caenispirillum bisanense]